MRTVSLVILLRLALLVAIAASAALVIEYQNVGDPAFCGVGSACFQVRISPQSSAIREMLGVSLPQIGLAAYATLLGASLIVRERLQHWMLASLATVGALFALYLLYAQKVEIGAMCQWCVAVDVSAIVVAAAAIAVALRSAGEEASTWRTISGGSKVALGWAVAGALAIGVPFVWGNNPVIPPPPPDVAALRVPGKVVYLEFTDFQCPFCRKLHPVIEELRHAYGDRLIFIRKMKPLSGHAGALPAALAYLCTPEPRRDEMAAALYEVNSDDLTPAGVAAIAGKLGLDREGFAACVEAPATKQLLDDDGQLYERIGPKGLPLSFIDDRVVVGFDAAKVRRSVAAQASGSRIALPLWAMFAVLAAIYAGAAAYTWKRAS